MKTFLCSNCGNVCGYETMKDGEAKDHANSGWAVGGFIMIIGLIFLGLWVTLGIIVMIVGFAIIASSGGLGFGGSMRIRCCHCGKINDVPIN